MHEPGRRAPVRERAVVATERPAHVGTGATHRDCHRDARDRRGHARADGKGEGDRLDEGECRSLEPTNPFSDPCRALRLHSHREGVLPLLQRVCGTIVVRVRELFRLRVGPGPRGPRCKTGTRRVRQLRRSGPKRSGRNAPVYNSRSKPLQMDRSQVKSLVKL